MKGKEAARYRDRRTGKEITAAERTALMARMMADEHAQLDEIGERFGVSGERARQILASSGVEGRRDREARELDERDPGRTLRAALPTLEPCTQTAATRLLGASWHQIERRVPEAAEMLRAERRRRVDARILPLWEAWQGGATWREVAALDPGRSPHAVTEEVRRWAAEEGLPLRKGILIGASDRPTKALALHEEEGLPWKEVAARLGYANAESAKSAGYKRRSRDGTPATRGRRTRGSRNAQSKLTESDVHEIRRVRNEVGGNELAARYGVSPRQIWAIRTGRAWSWLETEGQAGGGVG